MSKLQAKNEVIINAPVSKVWRLITDIDQLHKINPGVITATGSMDQLNGTRTCQMENGSKKGTMVGKLVEMIPEKKTVWSIESDTMGMSKMLRNTRFCFCLEKVDSNKTRITNESHYSPSNLIASVMNVLVMKRMMTKIQEQILDNIKRLAENNQTEENASESFNLFSKNL